MVGVRNGPESEDAGRIDAGDGRSERRGTCRDDELVIGLAVFFAGLELFDAHHSVRPVDRDRFAAGAHVDAETLAHDFGLRDEQRVTALDHASDMIGEPAVGVGNVLAALNEDDVESAQSRGTAGAGGDTADDQYFVHMCSFL